VARAEKTVVLNVRVSENQAKWLRRLAEAEHSGNLSEAVRQALTDSWILRRVREDYKQLEDEMGFQFPRHLDDKTTRAIELFLSSTWSKNLTMTWEMMRPNGSDPEPRS